jgi:hypothetical protein
MNKAISLFVLISFSLFMSHSSYSQTSDWVWAKSAGGIDMDMASSVATDAEGNSYIVGNFDSPILIFGSDTLKLTTGIMYTDNFIAKYDINGNLLWAKSFGSTGSDYARSVAIDHIGNLYVVGGFDGPTLTLDSVTLTNKHDLSMDIFLAKCDASGNVLWAKSAGGVDSDYANALAVDASGNAYITGEFWSDTLLIDSLTLASVGGEDVFLAKYNANGDALWAKSIGGSEFEFGRAVAIDTFGNAYIAGEFYSPTLTIGSTTLTNKTLGWEDIFLAKYDANGNVLWAKSIEGTQSEYARSVAVDASGNAYLTGDFSCPTLTIGSSTLTNAGEYDFFLAKYDSNGNVLWAKSAGGTAYDNATCVTADASGNIYVAGHFYSPTLICGSFALTSEGHRDIFLAKYDSNGEVIWATSAGGEENDYASCVTLDASGSPLVAGGFYSPTLNFGSTILTNANTMVSDIFLVKLSSSVGIIEPLSSLNISVYPNPSLTTITIKTANQGALSIINLQGQQVLTRQITEPKTQLDISNLPSGVYFVRLTGNNSVEVGRFVKQ